ncbi:hypothetical protein [Daejeonella oryzae]|uniref:hypothetical protein n=1 Tax=Daejeonella oryzae TaxID=1122943 RepID=UPI00042442E7|nr:hypothetical protein [Daejeonella oryzae]
MLENNQVKTNKNIQNSILSFSNLATTAYRMFSQEDFLNMMSEMSTEEIQLDIERFKNLKEDAICKKLEFVLKEKKNTELVDLSSLLKVNI